MDNGSARSRAVLHYNIFLVNCSNWFASLALVSECVGLGLKKYLLETLLTRPATTSAAGTLAPEVRREDVEMCLSGIRGKSSGGLK